MNRYKVIYYIVNYLLLYLVTFILPNEIDRSSQNQLEIMKLEIGNRKSEIGISSLEWTILDNPVITA
jgi:hypothetical protein